MASSSRIAIVEPRSNSTSRHQLWVRFDVRRPGLVTESILANRIANSAMRAWLQSDEISSQFLETSSTSRDSNREPLAKVLYPKPDCGIAYQCRVRRHQSGSLALTKRVMVDPFPLFFGMVCLWDRNPTCSKTKYFESQGNSLLQA